MGKLFKIIETHPERKKFVLNPEMYEIESSRNKNPLIVNHLYDADDGAEKGLIATSRTINEIPERLIQSCYNSLPGIHALLDYHWFLLRDEKVSKVKSVVKGREIITNYDVFSEVSELPLSEEAIMELML